MNQENSNNRIGLVQALLAALLWGIIPMYFKALESIPALEIVAHRIIWSVPILLIILWLRKNLKGIGETLRQPGNRLYLFASAIFIAANWLIYVWAVNQDHVLAASLGYFVSPLLNVVLGMLVLKEKLSAKQWIAVAIAALGVSILAVEAWQTLWISMALAGSWGLYSLIRKIAPVGPMVGLTVETGVLAPVFLSYLFWLTVSGNGGSFTQSVTIDLLLIGGAVVTAVPLLLFASAVKKISLTTIGLVQYIAPSIQFVLGVFLYGETLTTSHIICFVLIWTSLAIFSFDAWSEGKRKRLAAADAVVSGT